MENFNGFNNHFDSISFDIHVKNKYNGFRIEYTGCSIPQHSNPKKFIDDFKIINPHLDIYFIENPHMIAYKDIDVYTLERG